MTNLVILRHGQSFTNAGRHIDHEDQNLVTEHGILSTMRHAKMLRSVFPDLHFDHTFVSPMHRAIQTNLNFISTFDNRPVYVEVQPDLHERVFGFDGFIKIEELVRLYGQKEVDSWESDLSAVPGDSRGESIQQVYDRVINVYTKHVMPRLQAGETVLITAHYYVIKVLQSHIEFSDVTKSALYDPRNCLPITYHINT